MAAPIRLSQLNLLIQETLAQTFAFQRFWLIAEVSNHSYYAQKGFHYFDLVEYKGGGGSSRVRTMVAKIGAAAWTTGTTRIAAFETATGQRFTNDIEVLVEVAVDYHPVYGLKLTLLDIDPRFTLGQQEQQRQLTIERLVRDHPDYAWLTPEGELETFNQELELPLVIQNIAIVSSRTAAGYEDFLHSLENNPFNYKFSIDGFFTIVQGESNATAVAATLEEVAAAARRSGIDYDAVVIIRGGGASTDLLIFDQFEIALSVAACPFPVLTGIGHQRNETITDLVANTALKTPTKVAEFILQHNRNFEQEITGLHQTIRVQSRQLLAVARQEMLQLKSGLVHQLQGLIFQHKHSLQQWKLMLGRQPVIMLHHKQHDMQRMREQLQIFSKNYMRHHQQEMEGLKKVFKLSSPERLLQRGFALVESKGKIVSDATGINTGDDINVILSGTTLGATVKSKNIYNGKPFDI